MIKRILLALLIAGLIVAGLVWLSNRDAIHAGPPIPPGPGEAASLRAAQQPAAGAVLPPVPTTALARAASGAQPGAGVGQPAARSSDPIIDPITFAAVGDFGTAGTTEQAVAALVTSWNPDLIITLGDNNYPTGAETTIDPNIGQYYHDYIGDYRGQFGRGSSENRFFPALGNHDWLAPGAQPYVQFFSLPNNGRYYDYVKGPVHFWVLDSDTHEPDGITADSKQARWLEDSMSQSHACWKIVYFHHPPYSSGTHGNTVKLQWPFKDWGASAVLSGHEHDYERLSVDGLTYFVNGLGGESLYDFNRPVPGSQVRYNGGFGAMRVTATRNTITYQFIGLDGHVHDSYTQTGGCG